MNTPNPSITPAGSAGTAHDEAAEICRNLIRIDTSNYGRGESKGERRAAERDTPRSKYLTGGGKLGGFGDNEASGKALPCHRVPEDGLMRITASTVGVHLGRVRVVGADADV